ncbi:hypothetical protein NHX12_017452 [Muraenolepis orangiensis]|uniref:Uncharacterized protein n=1 Tax=Muraenolepis orangiensis TaxID=630683 RepID=A0A9Q0D7J5_9TELE|nr:hypothetical protein NHX12_017452 [Muraenolepis orangiensis]
MLRGRLFNRVVNSEDTLIRWGQELGCGGRLTGVQERRKENLPCPPRAMASVSLSLSVIIKRTKRNSNPAKGIAHETLFTLPEFVLRAFLLSSRRERAHFTTR